MQTTLATWFKESPFLNGISPQLSRKQNVESSTRSVDTVSAMLSNRSYVGSDCGEPATKERIDTESRALSAHVVFRLPF